MSYLLLERSNELREPTILKVLESDVNKNMARYF